MIDTVVKVGGALLADRPLFDAVVAELASIPANGRTLIVPGGGPFADAVRAVDRTLGLGADAAHWAAILAMDQYAWVLASRLPQAVVADRPPFGGLGILAPYRWLRAADPLPHSWDVTSDSIAAWIAGAVGARRLLLIKPAAVPGATDRYFPCARPKALDARVLAAGRAGELNIALASDEVWHNLMVP